MKTALITGATDGIGRATAKDLLQRGWAVVITGRSESRCAATVEALRQAVAGAKVSALAADLSVMSDVQRLARSFCADHRSLDLLLLNANSITQTHVRTSEGFESNFAVGFLGRALLCQLLAGLLRSTPGAQVLTVVGLNLERIDFDDPSSERGFSSMKALGRWQWAMQVYARAWNAHEAVPMNVFMPGLVKTKILANEPQPMRLIVQLANVFVGISVERSAHEITQVIDQATTDRLRDVYFSRTTLKPPRNLKDQPGDQARMWELTHRWLAQWLA